MEAPLARPRSVTSCGGFSASRPTPVPRLGASGSQIWLWRSRVPLQARRPGVAGLCRGPHGNAQVLGRLPEE